MPWDFSSALTRDNKLAFARLRYAAFVYDEFKKDFALTHSKAVVMAAKEANVAPAALKIWLPKHNWERKIIRNHRIINARASGYSIQLIAKTHKIHRCTVRRVLEAFANRQKMIRRYASMRIYGRIIYTQLEFNFDGKT